MAKITINEPVHVEIRIDGTTIERDFTTGDVDVEQPIADLLIAQGLAAPASKGSKNVQTKPVPDETAIAESTPEA
jgi:hypothetical protein